MKTLTEMYQYCLKNNFDQGWSEDTIKLHMRIIEQNLQEDENVLMCFVGKREVMNGKCAFAITNKHIMWGQQVWGSPWHKEILFDTITTINFSGGTFSSMIIFSATSENNGVACSVKNNTAKAIYDICKRTFEEAKLELHKTNQNPSITSNADEILKYKNLLDIGAITQEEFEKKKKQLLDN